MGRFGVVMTTVKVAIAGGASLTAVITKDGGEDLSLSVGDEVTALVKSTGISIAIPWRVHALCRSGLAPCRGQTVRGTQRAHRSLRR